MARKTRRFIPITFALFLASVLIGTQSEHALAGAGDAASTYGLGPVNAGSAQAFSAFDPGAWAVYYNPAALARTPEGELSIVLQYGDQELRAKSLGGSDPVTRENDVLSDTSSELALLGIKARIGGNDVVQSGGVTNKVTQYPIAHINECSEYKKHGTHVHGQFHTI